MLYSEIMGFIYRQPHFWPAIIAAIMLLVAIAPFPYGYYQFLRWIICGIAIFIAYTTYHINRIWFMALFVAIAILFNPIMIIHFEKEIWQFIDIVCAAVFIASIFFIKKSPNTV
jgi:hypothetical protein